MPRQPVARQLEERREPLVAELPELAEPLQPGLELVPVLGVVAGVLATAMPPELAVAGVLPVVAVQLLVDVVAGVLVEVGAGDPVRSVAVSAAGSVEGTAVGSVDTGLEDPLAAGLD